MIAERRLAVLTCIMRTNDHLPEWLQKVYDDIRNQLCRLFFTPSVRDDFKTITVPLRKFVESKKENTFREDVLRAQWMGVNGVSCAVKVFVPLLCDSRHFVNAISEIVSMLYELDAYFSARRVFKQDQEKREQALRSIFELDEKCAFDAMFDAMPLKYMPTFENDVEEGLFVADQVKEYAQLASECVEIDVDHVLERCNEACMSWMPSIAHYVAYVFHMTNDYQRFDTKNVRISLLAAIACANETDRISKSNDQNKMRTFLWSDEKSQSAYVKALGRSFYAAHYEQKAHEELKIRSAKAY